MDIRNAIASKAIDAGGRLRVKSALNPMLWLCAIVTIPGLVYMTAMLVEEEAAPYFL